MREIVGVLAVIVALGGYVPYLRDIARRRTRPHSVSWLIWSTLAVIVLAAQISDGGGSGTWVMALVTFMSVLIFLLALVRGDRSVSPVEGSCLIAAVLAGLAWVITDSPLISVVLATAIDSLGFIPTFRKSYSRPDQETASLFALVGTSFGLSLLALNNFSVVTALNPATMACVNALMVAWLAYRRHAVRAAAANDESVMTGSAASPPIDSH